MFETGIVKEIKNGEATISLTQTDACKECHGCLLSNDGKSMLLKIKTSLKISPGDRVLLQLDSKSFLLAGFLVLTFPLIMFFAGIFISSKYLVKHFTLLDTNTAGIIGGVVFFIIAVVIVYFIEHRPSKISALTPHIVSVEKSPEMNPSPESER